MIPRLRISGVKKSFGATKALSSVSLELAPGEVHALIGENGAGKSTLMKILSGAYQPDDGSIDLDGRSFAPSNPLQARNDGIAMIYQELNLAPDLSVEENILLGAEPSRWGWINKRERSRVAKQALAELHHPNIPLDAPVRRLSVAEQQMVEIARAIIGSPKVLIMDEPTSSLTQVDSENLFRVIDRLKCKGVSIIYISHFLEECQRVADRYTVLRDGYSVGTGCIKTSRPAEIIRLMVGRDIQDIYPKIPHAIGKPVLEVSAVSGRAKPKSVSFSLREGEIFGIAGLIGAGRTETLRACFGLDSINSGKISVWQRESTRATPAKRLSEGIGLLSENRKEEGLLLNRSLADNLTLTRLSPFSSGGFIKNSAQSEAAQMWIKRLSVRAQNPLQPISELSGGNQQKIAIGRLLHHQARIFLLDEPTRGIDVGSKAQIYHLIAELACEGKAVIFVSSYLPELLGVCDTIGVMCRGVLSEVRPVTEWTEHRIISAAIGQTEAAVD